MSEEAFTITGKYDAIISNYFSDLSKNIFSKNKIISYEKIEDLRYGENPHQKAAIYNLQGKKDQINPNKEVATSARTNKSAFIILYHG